MALLLGRGTPQSTTNRIGTIYHRAGTSGDLPSTQRLLRGFTRGRGTQDMIMGVKAGKGDYPSSIAPGYVYGQEPMSATEAVGTAGPLLDAALYGLPLNVQAAYGSGPGGWGSYLFDRWASKAMKRPAGKGPSVTRYVGRRLFR